MGEPTLVERQRTPQPGPTPAPERGARVGKVDRHAPFEEQEAALRPAARCVPPEAATSPADADAARDYLDKVRTHLASFDRVSTRVEGLAEEHIVEVAQLARGQEAIAAAQVKDATKTMTTPDALGLIGDILAIATSLASGFGLLRGLLGQRALGAGAALTGVSAMVSGGNAALAIPGRVAGKVPVSATTEAVAAQLGALTSQLGRLGACQIAVFAEFATRDIGTLADSMRALERRLPRLARDRSQEALHLEVETAIAAGEVRVGRMIARVGKAQQRLVGLKTHGHWAMRKGDRTRTLLESVMQHVDPTSGQSKASVQLGKVFQREVALDRRSLEFVGEGVTTDHELMLVSRSSAELASWGLERPPSDLGTGQWAIELGETEVKIVAGQLPEVEVVRQDRVHVWCGPYHREVSARVWDDQAARAAWIESVESWRDRGHPDPRVDKTLTTLGRE